MAKVSTVIPSHGLQLLCVNTSTLRLLIQMLVYAFHLPVNLFEDFELAVI